MIRSFLSERTTTLIVENEETSPQELTAGVPQRSPLSPILFIFYNLNLLESLNLPDSRLSPLGFADNVNLLIYRTSTAENCMSLELGYDKCLAWARTHGMQFSASKYTLVHFAQKGNFNRAATVQIGTTTMALSLTIQILGLQLDSELRWKAQVQSVSQRIKTQMHALTRTTASTWGATMTKARQIYLAMICPAMLLSRG
jgi:hypothetical protein